MQRIFRLCVKEGLSVYAIAARLTQEGIPTPQDRMRTLPARVWHTSTIAHILKNPAYTGTLYDGKTQRLPGKSHPDKKTRHRRVPREEWIAIPVPPLIDMATFEAAQAQLTSNRLPEPAQPQARLPLCQRTAALWPVCCAMTGATKDGDRRFYGCHRKPSQDAVAPHTKRTIQATAIEPVVWDAVERALNTPTLIAAELERRKDGTSTQQADLDRERQQYHRQLTQCDKDLKRWEAAYLGEAIDLADFKAKKAEVDARRASAEHELTRLDAEQRATEQAELETASLMEYCARVRQQLQHFTLEEKRRALEALNITVVWHPEQPPEIHGSIPVAIVSSAPPYTFFLLNGDMALHRD